MTSYRVFKLDPNSGSGPVWEPVGTFEGGNHRQAIRAAADKLGVDADGCTFAAVAENRWSEETVQVETNPRVKFA